MSMTKQEEEKRQQAHDEILYGGIRWALNIKVRAWTDRMLAALVNGVKGNVWYSLIDKVYKEDTLLKSWEMVRKNQGAAGLDKVTIEKFGTKVDKYLQEIKLEIQQGTFEPDPIRRTYIPKGDGKTRPLGIPTVKDRVVQAAIKQIIEPIFEKEFAKTSFGFRPNKGCKDALRMVQANLDQGYTWVIDADLKSYFDTIPHDKLMERVKEKIADGELITIIEKFLKAKIMENLKGWTPSCGVPQGGVLSPLLANIYLHPLDKMMEENGIKMIRYADDFVIMCKNQQDAQMAYEMMREWIEDNGLELHPEKTHIIDAKQPDVGFEFLGYRFENGQRYVRKKSLDKLKDKVRTMTKRNNGLALDVIIKKLNLTLKGWYNYFKQAHKWIFGSLDGWIRRRLRALLKRREKKTGMGKTLNDHLKWPNKFFATAGLFSLKIAWKHDIQALKAAKAR